MPGVINQEPLASPRLELGCTVSCMFLVRPLSRFQEIFIDQLLTFRCQLQLWNPQFKLSDNNSTPVGVVLKNHFGVFLKYNLKIKLHLRQKRVRQFFEEQIAVEGNESFNCSATV